MNQTDTGTPEAGRTKTNNIMQQAPVAAIGERTRDVSAAIDSLIDYARRRLALEPDDVDWARNRLIEELGVDSYTPRGAQCVPDAKTPDGMLGWLVEELKDAGYADDDSLPDDSFADRVMGILGATPSAVRRDFEGVERREGGMSAMQWLYDYSVAVGYVKKERLDQNPRFDSHGLVVTINQAKPEFRNMTKAAAGNSVAGGYPKCTICHENEGFAGRDKRTLRTVPVTLGGKPFFWQFSPYGYFDQHGICVNAEHTPMHVDRETFGNLIDFVDRFPGYFLGCNAALPRIGGSVLAHDHYQGGGELMPMHRAGAWATMRATDAVDLTEGADAAAADAAAASDAIIEILDWPGTAVRVVSNSRQAVIELSDRIRLGWIDYDNEALGIRGVGPEGQRSAVSPSVCVTSRGYEMNLILRNNAVSDEYPEGVFHAHPEFWAIKQEPIGLIEAQGLFVLPGRLVAQLTELEDALVAGAENPPEYEAAFAPQWRELKAALAGNREREAVRAAVRDELGSVCERILGNTAVFKKPAQTQEFLEGLGFRRA